MANSPNIAQAGSRFYPNLKDQVPYHAQVEFKQLRAMAYDLIDAKLDIIDKTISANTRIDADLVTGRFLAVIIREDVTGGWAVQFATNKDGSLKFKGTDIVTQSTAANTYTFYLFLGTSDIEALLVAHETGGSLSTSSSSGGSTGEASLFDPSKHQLLRNYAVDGSATLVITDGVPTGVTVVGGSSAGSGPAGQFALQTSGGAINQRATLVSTATLFQQQWARDNGELAMRWIFIDVTNVRSWIGLCIEDISDEATSTPTKSYAVFRYATDIDGTAFFRCASDNGSGVPEVTTTTIAVTANTLYKFRFRWDKNGSAIKFYSDDVLVATHTKIPSTTTLMRWICSTKALNAAAKTIGVEWVNFWF